jgi:two-component system chemotaxis response regulator CheB
MATIKKKLPTKKKIKTPVSAINSKKKIASKNNSLHIICIGASAGGLNAIGELLGQLQPGINAAVFVVFHLSRSSLGDIFLARLKKTTRLPCSIPASNEKVQADHVYLAAPDSHLLVQKDRVVIGHGPSENRFRPSIDVLFRSAAAHYGNRVIGIVLTGLLNDGTAGMWAIKQSGGQCIVQDPNEAEFPDMPLSVLENMEVDYCGSLKTMGVAIENLLNRSDPQKKEAPDIVRAESAISEKVASGIEVVSHLGEKSVYACPACGGGLWKINNGKLSHYRCHIGHSYTDQDMVLEQAEGVEQTLWVALRMMEERKLFMLKLANENSKKGLEKLNQSYRHQGKQLEVHIDKLKDLLFEIHKERT